MHDRAVDVLLSHFSSPHTRGCMILYSCCKSELKYCKVLLSVVEE